MLERSPQRAKAEEQLNAALKIAKRKAILWGTPALSIAVFDKNRAENFYLGRLEQQMTQVTDKYQQLRTIEQSEGFPNMRWYTELIKALGDHIPQGQKQRAYYPFAGNDIFWAAGFNNLVMEDKYYD